MTIQIVETKHLKDLPTGSAEIAPTQLLDADNIRTVLVNLDAGQAIAPCQMSATVLYYVIEGQGSLRVGNEEVRLQAGSLALVPAGAVRTIAADEPTRVLGVQVS
jgi:quercetin dioxygenase-like cupin family protein